MKLTPNMRAAILATIAAGTVLALDELVTRYVLRPHPVPVEMADDVIRLEKIGFRVVPACPLGCHHRDRTHIHAQAPGGMSVSISPNDRADHGFREVHLA